MEINSNKSESKRSNRHLADWREGGKINLRLNLFRAREVLKFP